MFGDRMLRVLAVIALSASLTLAAADLAMARAPLPEPVEFELSAASAPAGVAATRGFVARPVHAPRRFNLVGLAWKGRAEPEIALRTRRDGGEWTRWTPATGHHSASSSEPIWVGRADWVQYRMSRAVPRLRLHFINTMRTARAAARRPAARAAARPRSPRIRPRAAWGGEACPPRDVNYGSVRAAVVHHTVSANAYTKAQTPAAILAICRFHRNTNGWDDIGYNFVVDRFGRVWEGRSGGIDEAVMGAHAQGYNSQTTGISNLGTFTDVPQSEAAIAAMAKLIRWKLANHGVRSNGTTKLTSAGGESARYGAGVRRRFHRISGHRDTGITACPGEQLYRQLPELRVRVGERLHPGQPMRLDGDLPETVTYSPDGVALGGRLLDAGAFPVEGLEVELQELGPRGWRVLASGISDADGVFSAVTELDAPAVLRWEFTGDETYRPYRGDGVRVVVAPAISLAGSAEAILVDESVRFTGLITPAKRQGVRLFGEVDDDGVWRRAFRKKLSPRNGQISRSRTFDEAGDYRVSVVFAGDDVHAPALSPYVYVTVEDPFFPF